MRGAGRCGAWVAVACIAAVPSASGVRAQEALVLSGGGARGLAHIGVLLVMDSLGYDPDIVIGNSMGAVVGALYAAGYSPREIRERTVAIDWGAMFDATPVAVGPARAQRLPMLSLGLDLARRQVSRGVFGEWRLNRALAQLLFDANARAAGDFDRLPRRFRAVAVDLATGEKVVLADGDLARAVRASMAYPGFFAPVVWGDRVLVDGGLADNVPTIEARRLGAESLIAVDVSRLAPGVGSLDPLAVAQRALSLMQQNLHPDTLPATILIALTAEGGPAGPAFPDDPRPLIELGARTARTLLHPASTTRPAPRDRPPAPRVFSALRIETPDSALARLARRALAPLAPGPYDPAAVNAALDRLFSTGLVDGVWPRVERAGSGEDAVLAIRLDAPPRLSLSVAGGFDNDRGGRGWASLERRTALANRPAALSAAASTDGLQRWATLSLRVHPLARPHFVTTAGTYVQESSVRTQTEDVRTTTEMLRAGGWVALELPHILRERVITLSARLEHVDVEDAPGGSSFGPLLRVTEPASNGAIVGVPLHAEAEARWGALDYRRLAFAGSYTRASTAGQLAVLLDLHAVSGNAPADVLPALGDEHLVPGLRWGEVRGRARAVAGADAAMAAPFGGFVRLRVRTGAVAGRPRNWDDARWVSGAQLGGVWRIPLGTIEAGYGLATRGDGRIDVSVGRYF